MKKAVAAGAALVALIPTAMLGLVFTVLIATLTSNNEPAPYTGTPTYPLPAETGRISYFGDQTECQPMALWPQLGHQASCDMDQDPTLRYYLAMRWPDYPRSYPWLRQQRILITLPRTGKSVVVVPGDWGPHTRTGRDFDVSTAAMNALDANTDDTVNARYVDPTTPTGPITGPLPGLWLTSTTATNCNHVTGPVPATATTTITTPNGSKIRVHTCLANQAQALLNAAKTAHLPLTGGGYRSPEAQITVRKRNCGTTNYAIYEMPSSACTPPTAKPGASQHERGLAIDFECAGKTLQRTDPCYRWLTTHANQYGLKNFDKEPWHWSTSGS